MTFNRPAYLVKSVRAHLTQALEAVMFDDMEEFKACIRRAYIAALIHRSVLAIRKEEETQADIFGTIGNGSGHPLRRKMIAKETLR